MYNDTLDETYVKMLFLEYKFVYDRAKTFVHLFDINISVNLFFFLY